MQAYTQECLTTYSIYQFQNFTSPPNDPKPVLNRLRPICLNVFRIVNLHMFGATTHYKLAVSFKKQYFNNTDPFGFLVRESLPTERRRIYQTNRTVRMLQRS